LSKAITLIALTCFLVAGAAVASILSGESMSISEQATPAPVVTDPIANREAKQDRLTVLSLAQASLLPQQATAAADVLRQAYASSSAADVEAAKAVAALSQTAPGPVVAPAPATEPAAVAAPQPAKPKTASRPAPQKSYAVLSDAQIAGIRDRLRLSASQEYYWPSVETALRNVARKINAERLSNPHATAAQLDPDCEEVQQLKSAAMPLLFQLREDQKDEVRKLARIIGLEKVAAAI